MIPKFKLTGDTFIIPDKGTVLTAILTCNCDRDDLHYFIGKVINNHEIKGIQRNTKLCYS